MGPRVWRIGLRVLLLVSLALNAVAIGVLVRLAEFRDRTGLEGAGLPREIRRAFREMAPKDERLMEEVRALGAARRAVIEAGTARPVDPEALDRAFAAMRAQSAVTQEAAQAVLREAFLDDAEGGAR